MPWTLAFVLVVFAPLAAINYYVWRKVFPAVCELTTWDRRRVRIASICLHLWVSLLPVVYVTTYLAIGRRAVPIFSGGNLLIDIFFSYPFWIALVILVQLFLLFALHDILEILVLRFVPAAKEWSRRHTAQIHVSLAVFITLYSVVTIVRDTWTVRIVEHTVALPPEFKALHGFRIAQVSDVQGDGRTTASDLRGYVTKVNSLHPDIVFFAGDLVTSGILYIDSTADIMGGLKSRFGTIAAVGDHDMFSNKVLVMNALGRSGIRIIEDSTIILSVDSTRLAVSIVTYTYSQRPTKERLERLPAGAVGTYKILLVHQPAETIVQFARKNGYDLFLAGHTHGGGLAFGIPGLFLFAPATLETNYLSGLHRIGHMFLSVTNGLGMTLAPIRFNAPAEISIIDLQ